jgi:hypothetical protein
MSKTIFSEIPLGFTGSVVSFVAICSASRGLESCLKE